MLRIIITVSFIFSMTASASSDECAPLIMDLSDLQKIECKMVTDGSVKPKKGICKSCQKNSNIINQKYKIKLSENKLTEAFKTSMFSVLSNIFKVGGQAGYNPSLCSTTNLTETFSKNKKCANKNPSIIKEINNDILTEIANFTIKDKSYLDGGIANDFYAGQEKTCPVSQADLQNSVIKDIEKNISINEILKLADISKKVGSNYTELLKQAKSSGTNLEVLDHPLIKAMILNNPDAFIANAKSLKSPEEIKQFIGKPENISLLNKSENDHCQKLFQNFTDAICDSEVMSGNTEIANFEEFGKQIKKDFSADTHNFRKYEENMMPLFCSQFQNDNSEAVDLKKLSLTMTAMNNGHDVPNGINELLLTPSKKMAPFCAEYCKDNNCSNKLAGAGSSKIPESTTGILKSLFDFKAPMSEEKKKIFIESNILTESEAKLVQTTPVTEKKSSSTISAFNADKQREVFGKSSIPNNNAQIQNQNLANGNFSSQIPYSSNAAYNDSKLADSMEETSKKTPVLPPSTAELLRHMSSTNRDLLDRLVKERGAKEKYSYDEIKNQIAQMSKEKSLPLPVEQQTQFFDHEWSEVAPKVMPLIPEELKNHDNIADRQIASLGGKQTEKSVKDKKYFDQRNKALEQFGSGANNNATISDGSAIVMTVNNEQVLKKVRLDVPEDKIEKLNLSAILDQKMGSDKEGQKLLGLIEAKQNFLLDIEGKVAFMVEYSKDKNTFELKTLKNNLSPAVFEKMKIQISEFLTKNERKNTYQALKKELSAN